MSYRKDLYNRRKCLLIIDMVKDNFDKSKNLSITGQALKIIQPINELSDKIRKTDGKVVYSTDAFNHDDFIFSASMKPHSIAGTQGAELIDELEKYPEDFHFQKPSFSAFFKTDLFEYLEKEKIEMCLVAGIVTQICVLSTALDSIANGFKTILISDCSASYSKEFHERTLSLYEKGPLYPLLRIESSKVIIDSLKN